MLFLLSERDCYIGELTVAINERSNGALSIVFPYSAIYRLLQSGYIVEIEKRNAPDGRRRQYYRITEDGLVHLKQLLSTYHCFFENVNNILNREEDQHV